jgi:acyl dehydratase
MDRYFEDFAVGQTYTGGPLVVEPDEVRAFAERYDPQPFHLDPVAADASIFRGLTTSGWHTAALAMRMFVRSGVFTATGIVGLGVDELRWLKPVRPGDELHLHFAIVDATASSSGARGTLAVGMRVENQRGEIVMTQIAKLLIPTRPRARA